MGELARGERLQIMLADDELAALDDWRFANRMPSRASAVRELLKRGLAAEGVVIAGGVHSKDFGVLQPEISQGQEAPLVFARRPRSGAFRCGYYPRGRPKSAPHKRRASSLSPILFAAALRMSGLRRLVSLGGVTVRILRMFRGARVALAVLLGCRAMGLGGVFVMHGGFSMGLLGHGCFLGWLVRARTRGVRPGSSKSRIKSLALKRPSRVRNPAKSGAFIGDVAGAPP